MRAVILSSIVLLAVAAGAADEFAPELARPAVTFVPFGDESPGAGEEVPPLPGAVFDAEGPMPWLAPGIPGMLELALERAGAVNLITQAELAYAHKKRLDRELTADAPRGPLSRLAFMEGATHVVGGSFAKEGKELSFTVEVWPVEGETLDIPGGGSFRLPPFDADVERQAEIDELAAEMRRLGTELGTVWADTALSAEDKRNRSSEIRAAIEAKYARLLEITGEIVDVRAKEFSGKVEEVFSLVDAAAKFVLVATEADGGFIAREPTADLEAFEWYAKGAGRYYTGEQISFFLRAAEKDPDFAEAHLRLGWAHLKERAYAEATAELEKARALADYYPSAPTGLATISRKEDPENAEAAIHLFNEALAIDPSYAPVFEGQGGLYFAAEDYEAAREAYEKFIAVWPSSKDGYYALGNTLWLIGKDSPKWKTLLRSAIDNYQKSLSLDPEFAACHYNLASVYKIFENAEKASYHYIRYIKLEPESRKSKDIVETVEGWLPKFEAGSPLRGEVEAAISEWKAAYGSEE